MLAKLRCPVNLKIARRDAPATALGGLAGCLELLAVTGLLRRLPELPSSPRQGWSDGQMILAVLLLNLCGHDRVSDIDRLESDAGLTRLVRRCEPALFGRSPRERRFRKGRSRCFPSARSVRDWLGRFHREDHEGAGQREALTPERSDGHGLFREIPRRLLAAGAG